MPTIRDPGADDDADRSSDAASTFQLLERANAGETADTHDLVQDTLLNAFKRIGSFEYAESRLPMA